jgi:LPXTG-site transpeptidase (sortase) family protein
LPAEAATGLFAYPALGISAPLKRWGATSPMDIKEWEKLRTSLREGVSLTHTQERFSTTPLAYIIGHSSDYYPHTYAYIFAGLNKSKRNDTFTVNLDTQSYTYNVVDQQILDPNNLEAFNNLAPKDSTVQRVVLVTCWPRFTTQKRLVVVGERSIQ